MRGNIMSHAMKNEKWKSKFFLIWTGQAFSLLGSSLVDFALIWWLTIETGSENILAFSSLLALLPRMILGPFAGALIDRVNRKKVMLVADSAIAVVTIILIAMVHMNVISVAAVLVVLFLRSMGAMFHQPAMKSATALLVPEEQLARIGGFNNALNGAMKIVAPVAGAVLIELFELYAVLYIDVITAMIAVGTLLPVVIPGVEKKDETITAKAIVTETKEGMQYVWITRSLLFVVLTCTMCNFGCGPLEALKSLFVKEYFGGGALELSWLTAASGAGLIAGGLLMGVWGGCKRNLITSGIGWGGVGITLLIMGFLPASAYNWFMILTFFFGVSNAIGLAGLEAFYQTNVPVEYHGRVFSVLATLDNTTVPIGLLVATFIGDKIPIQFWYILTGVLHFSLFVFWSFSKTLKKCEEK